MTCGVTIAEYEYNAAGLRTKKTANGKIELYYYEGGRLAQITDGNNKLKFFFTRDAAGSLLNMIDYTSTTPVTYTYVYDAHGNVVGLADKTGAIPVTYVYDAWGNITGGLNGGIFTGEGQVLRDANPFRYASYQYDAETGFYYLKSRYYSPSLGRFLTRDVVPHQNLYQYAANNPIKNIDPSGYAEVESWADEMRLRSESMGFIDSEWHAGDGSRSAVQPKSIAEELRKNLLGAAGGTMSQVAKGYRSLTSSYLGGIEKGIIIDIAPVGRAVSGIATAAGYGDVLIGAFRDNSLSPEQKAWSIAKGGTSVAAADYVAGSTVAFLAPSNSLTSRSLGRVGLVFTVGLTVGTATGMATEAALDLVKGALFGN